MKEKVLEALANLGFKLNEEEGPEYGFTYEGLNLLYLYNENDEDFLNISLPGILEIEEGKALQACALIEKINSTLKYVKAYAIGNNVWLFYERELFGEEDLMAVISRIILHLEAAMAFARRAMAEIEAADEEEDDEADAEEIDNEDNNAYTEDGEDD